MENLPKNQSIKTTNTTDERDNNEIEYRDCGYGCVNRYNQNLGMEDEYENVNYNYSPDSPEGQDIHEGEYENRVEEYNYESY